MKSYHGAGNELRRWARRGFRGYPIGSIAAYGPTDQQATKLAVGIKRGEEEDVAVLHRWFSETEDARRNEAILTEVLAFLRDHKVKSLVMPEAIIGCPHEEGKDYPPGISCPQCPFWEGRDRWEKVRPSSPSV
jgi:hypothetical protein